LYCPTTPLSLAGTLLNNGTNPPTLATVNFQIANAMQISGGVWNNMGLTTCSQSFCDGVFIMGIPFFMGRTVYYGIKGATTPLGTGPFDAF
jgi:hypothetical protein